jgi:hypothetical protein
MWCISLTLSPQTLLLGGTVAVGAENICVQLKKYNNDGRSAPATVLDEELVVHMPIVALQGIPPNLLCHPPLLSLTSSLKILFSDIRIRERG